MVACPLRDIAINHYLPEKYRRRRTHTADGYRSSLELHVLPRWGAMTIAEITRDAVQDWVDSLAPVCGPSGAEKAYKCLRQVIRWAICKWALYVPDPTVGIEMPRKPAYKPETLTQRRLKRLVRGFVGHRHEATLIISAALGLRPGENYYLSWSQINWRTGAVPINGTLQETSRGLMEYPTKTAKGERDGYLPQWALDRLHHIWAALGRPKGRIIGDARPSCVAAAIQRHIKRHRLPRITMKNLRRTWGTIAAHSGVAIETVAAMMGHSDVQTTYRYYYALTAATARRAQRRVARSVLGKTCDDMYKGIILPMPEILVRAA